MTTAEQHQSNVLKLTGKMIEAHSEWEAAKDRYVKIKNGYLAGHVKGTADYKIAEYNASKDKNTQKAIADCAHYRAEVQAYAAMISALQTIDWS
jgi:hypothetical protein